MMRRRASIWIAVAVGLAAAAAIWFGGGALWRWFLAIHHIH